MADQARSSTRLVLAAGKSSRRRIPEEFRRIRRVAIGKARALQAVAQIGSVSEWVDFFLDGVIEIANEAIDIVGEITLLRQADMEKVQTLGKRASESAIKVLPNLYGQPIVNTSIVMQWTGFTRAGAQTVIDRFMNIGILTPKDADKKYGQSYMYKKYLDIFIGSDK